MQEVQVLLQDGWVLAVDKPAGLAVHQGAGIHLETLQVLVRAFPGLRARNGFEPTAVHRLDRETSGVVLFALRRPAMRALTEAWTRGDVKKQYIAVVERRVEGEAGVIDQPVEVDGVSRAARTVWRVLSRGARTTTLACDPESGRKHQLRRHLAGLGHPIVGDSTYGAKHAAPRLMLHAKRLDFPHPEDGRRVVVESPLPPGFAT